MVARVTILSTGTQARKLGLMMHISGNIPLQMRMAGSTLAAGRLVMTAATMLWKLMMAPLAV